jgi:hypothetical protein
MATHVLHLCIEQAGVGLLESICADQPCACEGVGSNVRWKELVAVVAVKI